MSRSTLPIAIAMTTAAVVVLTACGSGSSPKPSDKIAGADSGSPSASSPTALKGAPEIKLPSDVKVEIEDPTSKDATTSTAIADLKYAILALRDGFAQGNGQADSMVHAYAMDAGIYWAKRIQKIKAEDKTITGTYRYYDLDVSLNGKDTAAAHYCEDQRQAFSKDIKTGKVFRTTPSNNDFYRFTVFLTKNASGTWQVARESWTQGDKSCIRA
ncbi:hypothetical protein ABZ746_17180 [Streptomyces sp. NPDC020096]